MSLLPPSVMSPQRLPRRGDGAQRCDAKQPCTPCSKDREPDCVYQRSRVKHEIPPAVQASPFSLKGEPSPRCSSTSSVNSEGAYSAPDSPSPDPGSFASSLAYPNPPDTSSTEAGFLEFGMPDDRRTPAPPAPQTSETKLIPSQEDYLGYHQFATIFTSLSSLQSPPSPCQHHTPLSFLGPEHFHISDVMSSELDSKLCVYHFLRYHTHTLNRPTSPVQPPCCATAVEGDRDLPPRS